jgi:hypothetical protein
LNWTDPWAVDFRPRLPEAIAMSTVYGTMIVHRFDDG